MKTYVITLSQVFPTTQNVRKRLNFPISIGATLIKQLFTPPQALPL